MSARRFAIVTVVGIEGEPPSREGFTLTVGEDGSVEGTLGCDGFDRAGARDGRRALRTSERFERRYRWDERSSVRVEVRPLGAEEESPRATARAELLVVGVGPVARALVALAKTLGFRVRVAAGPGEPASGEFEGAVELVHTPDAAAVAALGAGPDTYVVICGHDTEFSQPALRALLPSEAPYLGMMGSRRHTGQLLDELRESGFDAPALARVHSPVGLDLGAETPEEIALSALAQIVSLRRTRAR